MALPDWRTRRWFLRKIYRGDTTGTEAGRIAYVDGIDDILAEPLTESGGKWLQSASSTGSQFNYAWLNGFELSDVAALTDWVRGYLEDDDVEVSLALVVAGVKYLSTDFSGVRH